MSSKKGIALTVGILVSITAMSFVVWFIPENNPVSFVVTDYESNLDYVKDVHTAIRESLNEDFQKVLNDEITSEQYIQIAEISSSQINSQIIQLIDSNPPSEWKESYGRYIESLKQFNSYIRETIVTANMIKENALETNIENSLQKISQMEEQIDILIESSDSSRP